MPCTACGPGCIVIAWATLPGPRGNKGSIGETLAALWHGPKDEFASIIKPSTNLRLDGFTFYPNVGLISASRSDLTTEENERRAASFLHTYGHIRLL